MPGTALIVGGGTLGHVIPGVAVARTLMQMDPSVTVHFVCSPRGADAAYLARERMPHTVLDAPRLSAALPWKFPQAILRAAAIIRTIQPGVILSKGGYVSIPICLVAKRRGIPLILHESDAIMGRANRWMAPWADAVCLGYAGHAARHMPSSIVTGNPVRAHLLEGHRSRGRARLGIPEDRPLLLVLGGSQGSQALNAAVIRHVDALLQMCAVLHVTGAGKGTEIVRAGYIQRELLSPEDLPDALAAADLALSRAGAGSIAELAAMGIPTILVPLQGIAHDHQVANAQRAVETGGAVLLQQHSLDRLPYVVRELTSDPARRERMARAIRALHRPAAAGQIAKIMLECLDRERCRA